MSTASSSNNETSASSSTMTTTTTALTGTMEELFQIWLSSCGDGDSNNYQQLHLQQQQQQQPHATPITTTPKVSYAVSTSSIATTTNSPSRLHQEACSFFRTLVKRTEFRTGTGLVLRTKSSHEEALAILIQQLGPALASTTNRPRHLKKRLDALDCLNGALRGCRGSIALSSRVVDLVGTFLLQHCGPIRIEEEEEGEVDRPPGAAGSSEPVWSVTAFDDVEERIRDTAVLGLTYLLQASMDTKVVLTTTYNSTPALSSSSDGNGIGPILLIPLRLAKHGVEHRCAAPEDESEGGGRFAVAVTGRALPGLSALSRSRRSLCLDLLRAAIDLVGMTLTATPTPHHPHLILSDTTGASPDLVLELATWTKFSADCLRGESDPRCLLQQLHLLYTVMQTLRPLFMGRLDVFPVADILDAVAPYYPIQFKPPPNDVHGITREGLRHALLQIMCCTDYDQYNDQNSSNNNNNADDDNASNMLGLSLGMILERLMPPSDVEQPTLTEVRECLEDLKCLLFPSSDNDNNGTNRVWTLTVQQVRQVSDASLYVNEQTSNAVASSGSSSVLAVEAQFAKGTADMCRGLVARIALATERSKNHQLWHGFVAEPVTNLASRLMSSPSSHHGRLAIAYLACLCSCGGPRTLQRCLEAGLGPLLDDKVTSNLSNDENLTTAIYGIGAFFASCRASLESAHNDGIILSPHPLLPYSGKTAEYMFHLLDRDSLVVRVAVVRCMESVLLSSPANHFSVVQREQICLFVQRLADAILHYDTSQTEPGQVQWLRACTMTLGGFIGLIDSDSPDEAKQPTDPSVFGTEELGSYVRQDLLMKLLTSANTSKSNGQPRYDWKVLALACRSCLRTATRIVASLVNSLGNALSSSDYRHAETLAGALSFMFKQQGSLAGRAYQELTSSPVTAFDILSALASVNSIPNRPEGIEAPNSMSALELPPTDSPSDATQSAIDQACLITAQLRTAYRSYVSMEHVEKLITITANCLPPLRDIDVLKLAVAVSCLSAALKPYPPLPQPFDPNLASTLRSMSIDLAEFAQSREYNLRARTYAAQCLYTILSQCLSSDPTCPVIDIVATLVPRLQHSWQSLLLEKTAYSLRQVAADIVDRLNFLAILASAAACRGHSSIEASNQVVVFLVDLACKKTARLAIVQKIECSVNLLELSALELTDLSNSISVGAAEALGSILAMGRGLPMWKQRVSHISMARVKSYLGADDLLAIPPGILAAACHLICAGDPQTSGKNNRDVMADIVMSGLAEGSVPVRQDYGSSLMKLVLASTIKLLSTSPDTLLRMVFFVVTGAMRAYVSASDMAAGDEMACKLLALQVLETVTHTLGASDDLKVVKPAVVSILAVAMNHASSLLRQTAVEVRNAWCVIE